MKDGHDIVSAIDAALREPVHVKRRVKLAYAGRKTLRGLQTRTDIARILRTIGIHFINTAGAVEQGRAQYLERRKNAALELGINLSDTAALRGIRGEEAKLLAALGLNHSGRQLRTMPDLADPSHMGTSATFLKSCLSPADAIDAEEPYSVPEGEFQPPA